MIPCNTFVKCIPDDCVVSIIKMDNPEEIKVYTNKNDIPKTKTKVMLFRPLHKININGEKRNSVQLVLEPRYSDNIVGNMIIFRSIYNVKDYISMSDLSWILLTTKELTSIICSKVVN